MADMVRPHYPIVPTHDWLKYGTWRETLEHELAHLRSTPRSMTLMCILWHWPDFVPKISKVEKKLASLPGYHGYNYHWEMTDERALNQLVIVGKFNKAILVDIMTEIEKAGANFENTWDMIIEFH